MNKVLAVIPVRKNSKRLPGKNIKKLMGKSLIEWAIEGALKANIFDKIVISSDSQEMLDLASKYPEVDVDLRSPNLAQDTSTCPQVLEEIVVRKSWQSKYDVIVLLPVTSPFRTEKHIQEAWNEFEGQADSLVSVTQYDISPDLALDLKEGQLNFTSSDSPLCKNITRSQEVRSLVHPNGSFYFSKMGTFLKSKSFFQSDMKGYLMSRHDSIDIDTQEDFDMAEWILNKRNSKE